MESKELIAAISESEIKEKIYTIRGMQVMLDSDLAEIYGYSTKAFNQQVKNNREKFPEDFMFRLSEQEVLILRSKNLTTIMQTKGVKGGRVYLPYVFTEQGIYMLMTVLKGDLATKQSIMIIRLFKQLEEPMEKKAALFFKGQLFDAFSCLVDIISKAKEVIVLIDNYVDTGTLDLLSKKKTGVSVSLITSKKGCKLTTKEISDFNNQYGNLAIKFSDEFHDRFMILDNKVLYHIGASLKDAGKKAFEISIIDDEGQLQEICRRIK